LESSDRAGDADLNIKQVKIDLRNLVGDGQPLLVPRQLGCAFARRKPFGMRRPDQYRDATGGVKAEAVIAVVAKHAVSLTQARLVRSPQTEKEGPCAKPTARLGDERQGVSPDFASDCTSPAEAWPPALG